MIDQIQWLKGFSAGLGEHLTDRQHTMFLNVIDSIEAEYVDLRDAPEQPTETQDEDAVDEGMLSDAEEFPCDDEVYGEAANEPAYSDTQTKIVGVAETGEAMAHLASNGASPSHERVGPADVVGFAVQATETIGSASEVSDEAVRAAGGEPEYSFGPRTA